MTRKGWLTAALALAFGALLGYININSKEVQLPMFCLLLFSFTLGLCQPTSAWRWGVLIGLSLPISYFVAFAANYRTIDAPSNPITLVILVIPALLAAYGGAFANRLSQAPEPQIKQNNRL